jgi:hypothetical protein
MFSFARIAFLAFTMTLIVPLAAFAQTTSASLEKELATAWHVALDGDARPRKLTIKKITATGDHTYSVDATFGFASAGQGAIKAELAVSGNERKLSFTTNADNLVQTTQSANGSFEGTFGTKGGKARRITFTKLEQLATEAAAAAAVIANRQLLAKSELEGIVLGKTWRLFRHSTGQTFAWEFRKDGIMFGVNQSFGGTGSSNWTVTDTGQLCFKYPGQGQSPDICYLVAKEGAAYKMFEATSPSVVHADLTVE